MGVIGFVKRTTPGAARPGARLAGIPAYPGQRADPRFVQAARKRV